MQERNYNMKYFTVYAETALPVYSDGSVELDADYAQDNIIKYVVDEYEEDGFVFHTKKYEVECFDEIAREHPSPEWENCNW